MLKKSILIGLILTCSYFSLELESKAADRVPVLGQVLGGAVAIDGVRVSSGTTLFDKSTVFTGSAPAFVHLLNGMVVKLMENSRATFQKTSEGEFHINVHSGELILQEADGEVVTLLSEGSFNLPTEPSLVKSMGPEESETSPFEPPGPPGPPDPPGPPGPPDPLGPPNRPELPPSANPPDLPDLPNPPDQAVPPGQAGGGQGRGQRGEE